MHDSKKLMIVRHSPLKQLRQEAIRPRPKPGGTKDEDKDDKGLT